MEYKVNKSSFSEVIKLKNILFKYFHKKIDLKTFIEYVIDEAPNKDDI